MATAGDMITRALRSLGVIAQGESADGDQLADGLVSLNEMLSSWSVERLTVYQTVQESIALVGGQADYDIGDGATSKDTARPLRIESAFIRSGGIDYPVEIVTRAQYNGIADKSLSSDLPFALYYDPSYPTSNIRLYPAPSGGTLYIDSWKPFSAFATVDDVVSFPPGYERAIRINLAVDLMPEYQIENRILAELAITTKAGIKRANHVPSVMTFDSAIPQGTGYNIQNA